MKNITLFCVAIVLFVILLPVALIYASIDSMSQIFGRLAISIDMAGNVLLANVMNDISISSNGYKFGNRKETISSVLGKNMKDGTLTAFGIFLQKALDFIDEDHCMRSIDTNI